MVRKRLREGFTTGSAAAAGAKAAIFFLSGRRGIKEVEIPLPIGGRLVIPVECVETLKEGVRATVVKDGGDDPDATHRAKVRSTVCLIPGSMNGQVTVYGGRGVGRVTRPGLPVAVGEAAINPVPRQQITEAVQEGLRESRLTGAVSVTIDVVNGEKIAKKTLNPRLGIIGGISILGTRGTVKPFSHEAYKETITLSMDVVRANGLDTVALSTGGKSEGFLKGIYPRLPDLVFIQVADFFAFSLEEATARGFHNIVYACFFGKLVKMAQGHPYTHAKASQIDFGALARWCRALGMEEGPSMGIVHANTAREALAYIRGGPRMEEILSDIVSRAMGAARPFAGPLPNLTYALFDPEGTRLILREEKGAES